MPYVNASIDYKRFDLAPHNRNVKTTKELEKSMRKYGWIDAYPMHVTKNGSGKYVIVSGHHRFQVAQKLGIAVKYVVTNDASPPIHELEKSTRTWSVENYLESFVRLGLAPYMAVKDYHDETGIGIKFCIALLSGGVTPAANKNDIWKAGTYQVGDRTHADRLKSLVLRIRSRGLGSALNQNMIHALSRFLCVPEFSPDTMIERLDANPGAFKRQLKLEDCMAHLEKIYNTKARQSSRVALVFRAAEVLAERNPIKKG